MTRNTTSSWGWPSKLLHWIGAIIVLLLLGHGWWMTHLAPRPDRLAHYAGHAALGYDLLLLLVLRLLWRWLNPVPALPGNPRRWEMIAARSGHIGLYVLLFAATVTGWALAGTGRNPLRSLTSSDCQFRPSRRTARFMVRSKTLTCISPTCWPRWSSCTFLARFGIISSSATMYCGGFGLARGPVRRMPFNRPAPGRSQAIDGARPFRRARMRKLLLAICTLSTLHVSAHAQTVVEFYKSKTIRMVVGIDVGSGYDVNARLLARHLVNHIPGRPAMVVQNQPGAGSATMTAQLSATGPFDGTGSAPPLRGCPRFHCSRREPCVSTQQNCSGSATPIARPTSPMSGTPRRCKASMT